MSDEEIIARCAVGDRCAMDVLVSRYHSRLLDFAFRQLGNREAAADVAQVALIRAFEAASSFDGRRAAFRTWLYTIALNLIREEFRKRARRGETPLCEVIETADTSRSPEDRAIAGELWESVSKLREEHSVAVVLRFRHQLSYDEIADVMNVPSGTVRSWVHYALKSLKKTLELTG